MVKFGMTQEYLTRVKKLLKKNTKKNTVSKEAARTYLIKLGIYTENGELHENYGRPKDDYSE